MLLFLISLYALGFSCLDQYIKERSVLPPIAGAKPRHISINVIRFMVPSHACVVVLDQSKSFDWALNLRKIGNNS